MLSIYHCSHLVCGTQHHIVELNAEGVFNLLEIMGKKIFGKQQYEPPCG